MSTNAEAMALFEKEAHSFVIRLWPENHRLETNWRGWVQHVQSGQKHYFQDNKTFYKVMENYLDQVPLIDDVVALTERGIQEDGKGKDR